MEQLDWDKLERGWHWLRRRRDQQARLGFNYGFGWRISDNIGRTTHYTRSNVANSFAHVVQVPEPGPAFECLLRAAGLTPVESGKAPERFGMADLRAQIRSEIINTPELRDFMAAVPIEALHQRERWGSGHDSGKAPADWFWLIGYLAGKALMSHIGGDSDKALHHTITVAAACLNWHAAIAGASIAMRPGIEPPAGDAA